MSVVRKTPMPALSSATCWPSEKVTVVFSGSMPAIRPLGS